MADPKLPPDLADTVSATTGASAAGEWRDGLRLGDRYTLRRFLGKGGMGQVWVAFDEVLDKEVALKRVRADVVGVGDALESLRREVLLAQTVTHVNVCRIYDLEQLGSDWVIKMELIGGRSLADLLRETPALPIAEAQRIARQLADGLTAVHVVGVVHRDLKPHNVLIDESGRAVLMDFGIARTTAPTGDTEASQVVGTPEYMAPEQARGEKVDARADLYALGCVLYRMLAGEVPFPAATRVAAMARHLTDPPPDARKKRPEVPAWLARLAQELMAKPPAQRPRDAATVAARLLGPPPRWPRVVAAGAATLLVVGIATAAVLGWRAHVRDSWRPELADLPGEYDTSGGRTLPSPDGQKVAFEVVRNYEWRVVVGDVRAAHLDLTSPAGYKLLAWARDGRSLIVRHESTLARFWLADQRVEPLGIDGWGAADCGDAGLVLVQSVPDLCPTCSRMVQQRHDGTTRELVAADPRRFPWGLVACDEASTRVAYTVSDVPGGQDHIYVRPFAAEAPVEIPDSAKHVAIKMGSFTPRDTLVVNALDGKTTHVWEVPLHGGRARQLGFGGDEFLPIATSDGRLFYTTSVTTTAVYRQRAGGGAPERLTFGEEYIRGATPTPDGSALILTLRRRYAGEQLLVLHPLDGGPEEILARSSSGEIYIASRFVDGELFYQVVPYLATRGPLSALSLRDRRTREVRDLPEGQLVDAGKGYVHFATATAALRVPLDGGPPTREAPAPWLALDEAPSGWRMAARRSKEGFIGVFAPGAPLDAPPLRTFDTFTFWSHDARAILYTHEGKILRQELATGRETTLAEPGAEASMPFESPDGQTLYYLKEEAHTRRRVMTNFAERPPL